MAVNQIVQKAGQDLKALRTTPEMVKTAEVQRQAHGELISMKAELVVTSLVFDQGDPRDPFSTNVISKEYKQIKYDSMSGSLKIQPMDDPEVSGIKFAYKI